MARGGPEGLHIPSRSNGPFAQIRQNFGCAASEMVSTAPIGGGVRKMAELLKIHIYSYTIPNLEFEVWVAALYPNGKVNMFLKAI